MSKAKELAAAADKLDVLVGNDLTPGPWTVQYECPDGEHHHDWDQVWIAGHARSTVAGLNERYTAAPRDAAYIAAMNPIVGASLANLLRWESRQKAPSPPALALARLINGDAS